MTEQPNSSDRIPNRSTPAHCPHCSDQGMVIVGLRRMDSGIVRDKDGNMSRSQGADDEYIDEYGPCPYCEWGSIIEYPPKGGKGPWGREGYWKGRVPLVRDEPDAFQPQLSKAENGLRLGLLALRHHMIESGTEGELPDPNVAYDEPDPKQRLRQVRAELNRIKAS